MMDRIDNALLRVADRFVEWNQHRGAADQWQIAAAFLDMAIALTISAALMAIYTSAGRFDVAVKILVVIFSLRLRKSQTQSIEVYKRLKDGARLWRQNDHSTRRNGLVTTLVISALLLPGLRMEDMALIVAYLLLDASRYAMAALPPAQDREEERVRSTVAT